MSDSNLILEVKGLNKWFGATYANKNIDFQLRPGEVRGLAGENGSGKSTLLTQIAGIQPSDSGEMFLNGTPYKPRSPLDATSSGVAIVVQELGLVPNLPAGINVFLGNEPVGTSPHSLPAAVRRYERGIAQNGGTGPRPGLRSPDPHFG